MTARDSRPLVHQFRLVIEAEDYADAVAFFRDALGLTERESFSGDGGAEVMILEAGRATIEISNPAQVRMIDLVEAEGQPSQRLRLAFEVDDAVSVTNVLVASGGRLIASPRPTPWRSLNSRIAAPAGLQVTIFQELGPGAFGEPELDL